MGERWCEQLIADRNEYINGSIGCAHDDVRHKKTELIAQELPPCLIDVNQKAGDEEKYRHRERLNEVLYVRICTAKTLDMNKYDAHHQYATCIVKCLVTQSHIIHPCLADRTQM